MAGPRLIEFAGPERVRRLAAAPNAKVIRKHKTKEIVAIILEPYGGEILRLGVSATTTLTALMAAGALAAFALAARVLTRGGDAHRIAAYGVLAGLGAFSAVIFAQPLA